MGSVRKPEYLFVIGCDGHSRAFVRAESFERATVKAAEFWQVPWREVAAHCYVIRKSEVKRNVCARCGGFFYGAETLCAKCACAVRDEEREMKIRLKRAYQTGKLV